MTYVELGRMSGRLARTCATQLAQAALWWALMLLRAGPLLVQAKQAVLPLTQPSSLLSPQLGCKAITVGDRCFIGPLWKSCIPFKVHDAQVVLKCQP